MTAAAAASIKGPIMSVPSARDFIDIMMSKTQRKTPTVIHRHFAISRIRHFYMRKVKFTQQSIHDRLSRIVDEFPKLDEVHPFYADLLNVLYDRDHYKIALSQVSVIRSKVDGVAREYVRLLKFADTLYRCKCLKRAALGRMCTLIRRHASTFVYLEQVRQHLSRLPSIDPNTRTLILCGFPNVGKSSFLNRITNADVDVQPYAFTTKSLFVGHTDYNFLRYQVVDTPGILDHSLEQRNTIEMQAITALAHLNACVLFMLDGSEQCGFSLRQQIDLFNGIRVLFEGKPLLVVLTKSDLATLDQIDVRDEIEAMANSILQMSVHDDDSVIRVRNQACELLLDHRIAQKLNSTKLMKKIENRLAIKSADEFDLSSRPPFIPTPVLERFGGGDNPRLHWKLEKEEEKFDKIPEIWNGHNIADFLDLDLDSKVRQLEEEEARLEAMGFYDLEEPEIRDLETKRLRKLGGRIREKRLLIMQESRLNSKIKQKLPTRVKERRTSEFRAQMDEIGLEPAVDGANYEMSSSRCSSIRKRAIRSSIEPKQNLSVVAKIPRNELGLKDAHAIRKAEKLRRIGQSKLKGRVGESDRRIPTKRPKHLFSGKRKGAAKTQMR